MVIEGSSALRSCLKPAILPQIVEAEPIFFDSYAGLGDALYMRPWVLERSRREPGGVYVSTAWPEAYHGHEDLVRCVPHSSRLRTQQVNIQRSSWRWHATPKPHHRVALDYGAWALRKNVSVVQGFHDQTGASPAIADFKLPIHPSWDAAADEVLEALEPRLRGRQLALVRPPTLRPEWKCNSRNPRPEYLEQLVETQRDRFFFVGVGFLQPPHEVLDCGRLHSLLDESFLEGQLAWTTIAALCARVDLVLASPCFLVPLCAAVGARAYFVFGGHVPPEILFDSRMGLDQIGWCAPTPFCNCQLMHHPCNKEISLAQVLGNLEELLAR